MFDNAVVNTMSKMPIIDFLREQGYKIQKAGKSVICITRGDELPVYVHLEAQTLFFEVDLGNITEMASKELYFKLLECNTEILPVSIAIDTTKKDDPRLVLVESRELENLDDTEILSVLDAMELAIDKVEKIMATYLQ